MNSLGQKIRELRIRKGLTQQELGAGIVTISMISQIESDKAYPSHKVLEQIADRLETPIEYFVADMQTQVEQNSTYKLAKSYLASGNTRQAIPLFKELLQNPAPHLTLHEVQFDLADSWLQNGEWEKAADLFEKVLDSVLRKNDDHTALLCLNKLGECRYSQENYTLALYHWQKAHETLSRLKKIDPFTRSRILTNLGNAHYHLSEFDNAVRYYREAYSLLRGSTNLRQLAEVYLGLGVSYKKLREFNRAIDYCHDALTIYESLQNIKQAIDVKAQYALVEAEQGNPEEAIKMLHECLSDYREQDIPISNARIHGEIARLYVKMGKLQQAEVFCQESLFLLPSDSDNLAAIYQALSIIKRQQGDLDAALDWLRRAIDHYKEQGMLRELRLSYQELADIYEQREDYMLATETLRESNSILDSSLRKIGILV